MNLAHKGTLCYALKKTVVSYVNILSKELSKTSHMGTEISVSKFDHFCPYGENSRFSNSILGSFFN